MRWLLKPVFRDLRSSWLVVFSKHVGDRQELKKKRVEFSSVTGQRWLFYTFNCNYSVRLNITIWFVFRATVVSLTINTIQVSTSTNMYCARHWAGCPGEWIWKTWQLFLSLIGVRFLKVAVIIFHYLKGPSVLNDQFYVIVYQKYFGKNGQQFDTVLEKSVFTQRWKSMCIWLIVILMISLMEDVKTKYGCALTSKIHRRPRHFIFSVTPAVGTEGWKLVPLVKMAAFQSSGVPASPESVAAFRAEDKKRKARAGLYLCRAGESMSNSLFPWVTFGGVPEFWVPVGFTLMRGGLNVTEQ